MRSIYSLNQIFMSVGMIFKRRSPECSVASGRAHHLAYGVTTSLCHVFFSFFFLTIPSFSSMTGLLTCLHNSQPGYCLQQLICLYELYFLFLFFPPAMAQRAHQHPQQMEISHLSVEPLYRQPRAAPLAPCPISAFNRKPFSYCHTGRGAT